MKQTLTTRHTYTTASVTEAASNSTPAEVAMPLLHAPPGEPRNCCCSTHCTVKRAKHICSFYTTQPSTQQEAQYTTAACQLLPLHARHCRCRCTDTVCHTQVPLLLLSAKQGHLLCREARFLPLLLPPPLIIYTHNHTGCASRLRTSSYSPRLCRKHTGCVATSSLLHTSIQLCSFSRSNHQLPPPVQLFGSRPAAATASKAFHTQPYSSAASAAVTFSPPPPLAAHHAMSSSHHCLASCVEKPFCQTKQHLSRCLCERFSQLHSSNPLPNRYQPNPTALLEAVLPHTMTKHTT